MAEEWVRDARPVRRVERDPAATVPAQGWPLTVPAVAQLLADGLDLAPGVTFLVGENGSGKSTLVEGVAEAFGLNAEGGTPYGRHRTRPSESPLGSWLRLVRGAGAPRWGFFLRAESMHGYYTYLEQEAGRSGYHELSHGESFLELVAQHLDNPGLHCLDEPEAALSFTSVLALVGRLDALARTGGQVLCATPLPRALRAAGRPDPRGRPLGACGRAPGTTCCSSSTAAASWLRPRGTCGTWSTEPRVSRPGRPGRRARRRRSRRARRRPRTRCSRGRRRPSPPGGPRAARRPTAARRSCCPPG